MPQDVDSKADEDAATVDGVGLEALRSSLGDFVMRAGIANERIPITRHGKPFAALVSIADLERLRALDGAAA